MAVVVLPTLTDSDNYGIKVTLESALYDFTFRWNYRESVWEMSIAGVVDGLAIRVNTDLLACVPSISKPPGRFLALDTSGAGLDPDIDELGGRVVLTYTES